MSISRDANNYRDIVIAGGGMVGISLALELSARLPESMSVMLVESFPFPNSNVDPTTQYHPSFDARSTALSYSSRRIYSRLGIWEKLQERCAAIETIHVSSLGRFGNTLLEAAAHNWEALGYVIENGWLGNVLIQALYSQGVVEVRSPASITAAVPSRRGLSLSFDKAKECVETGLLVIADGASSGLREALGFSVTEKNYGQHAVIANIASARPHNGCAYERFTDEGPLALLPLLPGPEGENRSALVWTLSPEQAAELQGCDEAAFLNQLQRRFGYRLGRLLQVGERTSYPLSLVQSQEQSRRHMVVMGNAAHALHPVAGQGFNLALRDVSALSAELTQGVAEGLSPGDPGVLDRYLTRQQADQVQTIAFSDQVPGLFMRRDPLLSLGRDLALMGMDIAGPLKQAFVRRAAGMSSAVGVNRG